MKSLKLISAGILACSIAGIASAVTGSAVNVIGATAFRTAVVNGQIAQLSHVGANLPGGVAETASIGASVTGATISMVHGYLADGVTEVVFRNHWTGSAAGVYDLTNASLISQLPMTVTPTTANVNLAAGSDTDTAAASMSFSDVQAPDVASSLGTGIGGAAYATTINGAGLVNAGTTPNAGTGVAAATFQWVLGKSAIAPANWAAPAAGTVPAYNLTQQNAATLIATGILNLATVTGNGADAATYLAFVGRNEDSGSRICYQAESLGGGTLGNANAFGAPTSQFMLKQSGIAYPTGPYNGTGADTNSYPAIAAVAGADAITGFKLWPRLQAYPLNTGWTVSTIPALTWKTIGHSGYNGGGDVKAILSSENPVTLAGHFVDTYSGLPAGATAVYFVSCVGNSDVSGIVGAGGVALKYNGTPYSVNAVNEGQYTLYTFEHEYYKSSLAGVEKTAADGLADTLAGFTAAQIGGAGLPVSGLLNGLNRSPSAGGRIN
jgi:hypothetical protein